MPTHNRKDSYATFYSTRLNKHIERTTFARVTLLTPGTRRRKQRHGEFVVLCQPGYGKPELAQLPRQSELPQQQGGLPGSSCPDTAKGPGHRSAARGAPWLSLARGPVGSVQVVIPPVGNGCRTQRIAFASADVNKRGSRGCFLNAIKGYNPWDRTVTPPCGGGSALSD